MKHTYLLLSLLLLSGISSAQNKTTIIDSMLHRTNRLGLFKGNVLVVDNGKVVYKGAIGFTDASQTAKLTTAYRFHIGSIAKEFNAVGIMMLKEQGKLSLDDKITKYLTNLPAWANQISIKNLLQYTSGVPDLKWKTVKNDADIWADMQKLEKLDFEPGTQYAYNNSNTFLQRRIIEKITGLTFNDFVVQKMLKPCGMSNSLLDPDDSTPLMAKSYNNDLKQSSLIYPITGWTAVILDDFYKWEKALESFKLINPASTKEILTPFAPNKQCGLGGGSMENNKLIIHEHDGTSLNYQALLTANAALGRTVILMTNNKQNNLYDINRTIQAILDGKPFKQPKKSVLTTFGKQLDSLKGEHIITFYNNLKTKYAADYGFEDEASLNEIGYYFKSKNRIDDALLVFEYNTTLFPTSGNVFDSLGETYYAKGNKEKALLNYKRSLQLDPTNNTAKAFIANMEKK
ncbi:serine hydrolase [Mucilaginibacter aquariorum]|uniref:Serine hydrolase n=1 Tax=Mucilaginibacter aquariorum TaxID=2967225 RepID=A0ABT1T8N9_9SPHI|nr:serine hydrolase [Mucilaginibacter aquariorum]MCQ6960989.1 serine hydrolase [Mucilaginibacter aquariorum]